MLREKTHKFRILYPVKLPFTTEGEIKAFSDKQKLRESVAGRLAFQEMLQVVL